MAILKTPENFEKENQLSLMKWVIETIEKSNVLFYPLDKNNNSDGSTNISIKYVDEFDRNGHMKAVQGAVNNSKAIHKVLGDIQDTLRHHGHMCTQAMGDSNIQLIQTNLCEDGERVTEEFTRHHALQFSFASRGELVKNMTEKFRAEEPTNNNSIRLK